LDKFEFIHIIYLEQWRINTYRFYCSGGAPDGQLICLEFESLLPNVISPFVRPSPRVCQILLGKSCVWPTFKNICQVKKIVHLQQFGIIHLSNPDLIYIRIPERNKNLFAPFHLLKTYIRNPFLFFISFFTLPPRGKHRWQPRSARTYIHVGRWVLPSLYFCQVDLPNCWRPNFLVSPKLDGCQVGLSNCWSCSY
jgi:hypothetical protein